MTDDRTAAEAARLSEPRDAALKAVMIGGNHLASALIGIIGGNLPDYRQASYDDILTKFNQPAADMWVAWKAIMGLRDSLEAARPTPGEGETKELEFAVAQLRHAYQNLVTPEHENGTSRLWFMKERKAFADGLIAPQIRTLETFLAALSPSPTREKEK